MSATAARRRVGLILKTLALALSCFALGGAATVATLHAYGVAEPSPLMRLADALCRELVNLEPSPHAVPIPDKLFSERLDP